MTERNKIEAAAIVTVLLVLWFTGPTLIWGAKGFLVATGVFALVVLAGSLLWIVYAIMWIPESGRPTPPPQPHYRRDDDGGGNG